jgi:hypothetical protein
VARAHRVVARATGEGAVNGGLRTYVAAALTGRLHAEHERQMEAVRADAEARLGRRVTLHFDHVYRQWGFCTRAPKVRHAPRPRLHSFAVTDNAIEDAMPAVLEKVLGGRIAHVFGLSLRFDAEAAARYLKRAARRVRMARKKRRGW